VYKTSQFIVLIFSAFHGAAGSGSLRFLSDHLEFQLGERSFIFNREAHGIRLDNKFERS